MNYIAGAQNVIIDAIHCDFGHSDYDFYIIEYNLFYNNVFYIILGLLLITFIYRYILINKKYKNININKKQIKKLKIIYISNFITIIGFFIIYKIVKNNVKNMITIKYMDITLVLEIIISIILIIFELVLSHSINKKEKQNEHNENKTD